MNLIQAERCPSGQRDAVGEGYSGPMDGMRECLGYPSSSGKAIAFEPF